MTPAQAAHHQADLANLDAEMLRELQLAHKIMSRCLSIMSVNQMRVLAERCGHDGLSGAADITRNSERAALINKAGGAA